MIKKSICNIAYQQIRLSFMHCGIITCNLNDFYKNLQDLIKRNGIQAHPINILERFTAREKIQNIRRRNTKSHTAEKYKF